MLNLEEEISYEIIIVDTDTRTTIDLIHSKKVKTITSKKGRGNQMNAGGKIAKGETLLFLHADTLLPKNPLTIIKNTIKEKTVAGAFDLSFSNPSLPMKIIATTANYRSRATKIPYGDQAIFIQKDIFKKINGFSDFLIMEDVDLMRKLKQQNYQIEISKEKVITSPRKWEERGVMYTTLRNWVLISLYFLGKDPNSLAKFYK